jgi:hypothetical protein
LSGFSVAYCGPDSELKKMASIERLDNLPVATLCYAITLLGKPCALSSSFGTLLQRRYLLEGGNF